MPAGLVLRCDWLFHVSRSRLVLRSPPSLRAFPGTDALLKGYGEKTSCEKWYSSRMAMAGQNDGDELVGVLEVCTPRVYTCMLGYTDSSMLHWRTDIL